MHLTEEGDVRTYLYTRLPNEDEYRPHSGRYFTDVEEARTWCNEQLSDENVEKIYELKELADAAMAEFYSPQNRSKYDYNE
jgi:hypothetical protein